MSDLDPDDGGPIAEPLRVRARHRIEARQAARELRKDLRSADDVRVLDAIQSHDRIADAVIAEIGEPPAGESWISWLVAHWGDVLRIVLALLALI